MIPRRLSPKAEELLRRVEARERQQKRSELPPRMADPNWPFPFAPVGVLGENPLDLLPAKKRR